VSGGAAGQLEYAVSKAAAGGFNPAATMGYNDQSEFQDSRAEAKRAAAERMQLLRQVRTCVDFSYIALLFLVCVRVWVILRAKRAGVNYVCSVQPCGFWQLTKF
jgi:hypothetical protein